MNRVLIVEDEKALREHLSELFLSENFAVSACESLPELEKLLGSQANADVVILDRLLHGKDAGQSVPKLKSEMVGTKVMILSAINSPSEKASLLDLGADDYLAKPFAGEELIARVKALLRRSSSVLRLGNLALHVEDRKIYIGEQEIQLTNKEFLFLKTLLQSPGKVFPKDTLLEKVWDMSPDVETNVVETTVNKLRRRFEEMNSSVEIKNARNVGYWIEE